MRTPPSDAGYPLFNAVPQSDELPMTAPKRAPCAALFFCLALITPPPRHTSAPSSLFPDTPIATPSPHPPPAIPPMPCYPRLNQPFPHLECNILCNQNPRPIRRLCKCLVRNGLQMRRFDSPLDWGSRGRWFESSRPDHPHTNSTRTLPWAIELLRVRYGDAVPPPSMLRDTQSMR